MSESFNKNNNNEAENRSYISTQPAIRPWSLHRKETPTPRGQIRGQEQVTPLTDRVPKVFLGLVPGAHEY
jgi:hypothetical protein